MKKNLLNRRIMVHGVWYTIGTFDFNTNEPDDDKHQWGGCTYNDKSILIDTNIPKAQVVPVLAHETAHAILQEFGVDRLLAEVLTEAVEATKKGETVDIEALALKLEEEICDSMETGHKSFKNI